MRPCPARPACVNPTRRGRVVRFRSALYLLLLGVMAWPPAALAGDVDVAPRSERWNLVDAEIREQLGRECLAGAAVLDDVSFTNGVIEVDVAVDGSRSYPGIAFRRHSEGNYERVYLRPHRAGLYPDAVQYTPVRNGVAGWQLYHGPGYTAGVELPADEWIHLRLEVHGTQARLFVGDAAEPALEVDALGHGLSSGAIGLLGPKNDTACFSSFRYRIDDALRFEEPPKTETPAGTLLDWEISKAYPAARVDRSRYPHFFSIFSAGWEKVTPQASGLVDIAAFRARSGSGPDLVLARTVVQARRRQEVALSFGYSDEVDLFLNGKKVFAGRSAYRGRDPSFLGVVGLFDTAVLTLQPGLNEILLMVTETFGGWGFMARAEPALAPPVREHERAVRVWETSKEFLTPETVLFDSDRQVLYVSNFDVQFARTPEHTGFISRLGLDGVVRDLRWVTDLDAPAGMGIHAGRLYVAERGHLTEIDIERGAIVTRHPIPDSEFLDLPVGHPTVVPHRQPHLPVPGRCRRGLARRGDRAGERPVDPRRRAARRQLRGRDLQGGESRGPAGSERDVARRWDPRRHPCRRPWALPRVALGGTDVPDLTRRGGGRDPRYDE